MSSLFDKGQGKLVEVEGAVGMTAISVKLSLKPYRKNTSMNVRPLNVPEYASRLWKPEACVAAIVERR